MPESAHFTPQTFKFLHALARHNERDWFKAHQDTYEQAVRAPFLALITALQAPLAQISPHFRADPRKLGGSLFRIQRDTRFSGDKQPYKTWAGARLFHERHRERPAPSFYLHIQAGECFVGAGVWHPESATLKQLRAFIADNPADGGVRSMPRPSPAVTNSGASACSARRRGTRRIIRCSRI
ncbi:hypothetical protein B1A_08810 [mine drainage metagenome]|uniref:Uncharacterized protein n=1 Tax=mine drainage metagenome TaxID=410659 RepID=T1B3S4_9ZZZZ